MKSDKERLREQARDKQKKINKSRDKSHEKNKKENMEKIGISICLKKRKKGLKEYQKNYREAKKSQYNKK